MKIIILGAGQVGATLAENLAGEENEITLVDIDAEALHQLQDKFDLQVVVGHCSHPEILRQAGAEDADMLIAVTRSDEVNMMACQVAYSIFNTPTKIARIRSQQYLLYREQLFHNHDLPVDHYIAPETRNMEFGLLSVYPDSLVVDNCTPECAQATSRTRRNL